MCLVNENDLPKSPKNASPRSPWAKFLNRQNAKPRLPRKVVTSARVNLNKCWSKLGELISNSSARSELPNSTTAYAEEEPILVPFTDFFYPSDPVKPENDKAENEGTGNGRFELLTDDVELLDNAANENNTHNPPQIQTQQRLDKIHVKMHLHTVLLFLLKMHNYASSYIILVLLLYQQ
ncbi:hypothetical protein EVAR_94705_1 [Eumeta japonica]|uniref:Uncharacterized protein n=1 Tax=Eumeta variegata TaxID=151549 RepID=A0A4C1UVQ8_EUMVA|nr:hypothetical protein EVAR_94705_1 [Eumeta japonica]